MEDIAHTSVYKTYQYVVLPRVHLHDVDVQILTMELLHEAIP